MLNIIHSLWFILREKNILTYYTLANQWSPLLTNWTPNLTKFSNDSKPRKTPFNYLQTIKSQTSTTLSNRHNNIHLVMMRIPAMSKKFHFKKNIKLQYTWPSNSSMQWKKLKLCPKKKFMHTATLACLSTPFLDIFLNRLTLSSTAYPISIHMPCESQIKFWHMLRMMSKMNRSIYGWMANFRHKTQIQRLSYKICLLSCECECPITETKFKFNCFFTSRSWPKFRHNLIWLTESHPF